MAQATLDGAEDLRPCFRIEFNSLILRASGYRVDRQGRTARHGDANPPRCRGGRHGPGPRHNLCIFRRYDGVDSIPTNGCRYGSPVSLVGRSDGRRVELSRAPRRQSSKVAGV